MLPRHQPDRIRIAFDDHRLVANAGLILPSTLALRLGLPQLVDRRLDLGDAPGRANTARGAAHFLRETVSRVRYGGGPGDNSLCGPTAASILTLSSPSAAGWMPASPSPSASTKACGT